MRLTVQLPDRVDHVIVVRVDQVRLTVGMTGQMKLHHPLVRHRTDIFGRVEVMIDA